jgi:hypothetical protein
VLLSLLAQKLSLKAINRVIVDDDDDDDDDELPLIKKIPFLIHNTLFYE